MIEIQSPSIALVKIIDYDLYFENLRMKSFEDFENSTMVAKF